MKKILFAVPLLLLMACSGNSIHHEGHQGILDGDKKITCIVDIDTGHNTNDYVSAITCSTGDHS